MRSVSIIGVGQIPVGEHWDKSLRQLGAEALLLALADAGDIKPDAVYIGNAYGASVSEQSHLGPLILDYAGLNGPETFVVEGADASGGLALRTGYMAVASGLVDTAVVLGVEKLTDAVAAERVRRRNVSIDADYEAVHGATETALAALLMRRYMHECGVELSAFEGFSVNAHANGRLNANAMFRNNLRAGAFAKAPMVAEPVNLFDRAPDADGAAAVVLVASEVAADLAPKPIRIAGSAVSTDTMTLQARSDMLHFGAVEKSIRDALQQAGIAQADVDLFEIHDTFTIFSVLTLEAAGFASRGEGWKLAAGEVPSIGLRGKLPISTMGGLKSRGNPAGATGIYQAVEAVLQLQGKASDNQVADAKVALIQSLGGLASTAATHVLRIL